MDISDLFNLLVAVIIIGSSVLSTFIAQKKKAEKKRKDTMEDGEDNLFGDIFSTKQKPEIRPEEPEVITKSMLEPAAAKVAQSKERKRQKPQRMRDHEVKKPDITTRQQSIRPPLSTKKRPPKLHPLIQKEQETSIPLTLDGLIRSKRYSPAQKMIIFDTILNHSPANNYAIQAPTVRKG